MHITRRAALGGALSFGAASSATAAISAIEPEHPVKRLHKLAAEASRLMPAFNDQMGSPWELQVRAPTSNGNPYVFYRDAFELPRSAQIKQHLLALKALCEAETGCKWNIIGATAPRSGQDGFIAINGDGRVHDPYGYMGAPVVMDGMSGAVTL